MPATDIIEQSNTTLTQKLNAMKHFMLMLGMLFAMAIVAPSAAKAGGKQEARIAYVLKNLKLKSDVQAKFKPLLAAYFKELSDVKAPYKALKQKWEVAIDNDKLSAEQCDQLFELKMKQEEAEVALQRKHYPLFKAAVTTQQAYKAFKLSDDKMK